MYSGCCISISIGHLLFVMSTYIIGERWDVFEKAELNWAERKSPKVILQCALIILHTDSSCHLKVWKYDFSSQNIFFQNRSFHTDVHKIRRPFCTLRDESKKCLSLLRSKKWDKPWCGAWLFRFCAFSGQANIRLYIWLPPPPPAHLGKSFLLGHVWELYKT